MTTLITGLFQDHEAGLSAANDLKRRSFAEDDVRYVTATSNYFAGSGEASSWEAALLASLRRDGLSEADAAVHVTGVANGGALVTVRAQFGEAARAIRIVRSFAPGEFHTYVATDFSGAHDPAPISWAFGLPVLTKTMSPFSEFFGLPMLAAAKAKGKWLLINTAAPLSAALGLPTLAGGAAPLSGLFKLPLLIRERMRA
jgi:hypothetical protein